MEFIFTVTGDRLRLKKGSVAISGNANTYVCNFEFSEDYLGLTKFAVFSSGEEFYTVEIKDCTCALPTEAISGEGIMQVGVFATNALAEDFKRISTNYIGLNIQTGAYSIYSQPKTPDIWESYLLEVMNERKAAEEAAKLAAKNTADETAAMLQAEIDAAKKECSEAASNANAAAERVTEPLSAENISYDNSEAKLSSTSVGGAITELAALHKANAQTIEENAEKISVNAGGIKINTEKLAENSQKIEANTEAIAKNKADAEKGLAEVKEASSLQFANALKGVVSGEAIRVDDVSPVSHNVSVKVRSANILDYTKFRQSQTISGITYTRSDDVMTIDGTATDTIYIFPWSPNIILGKEGDSFEMSMEHIGGTVNEGSVTATFNIGDTVDGAVIPWRSISSQSLQGGVKALPYTPSYLRNFYIYLPAGTSVSNYSFKLKLAKGSAVTAYTPYINDLRGVAVTVSSDQDAEGEVYISNSDGVIEGIKSKSLNMTLATDTEGVVIDLEYNKDINKALLELTNAIISLGGNV